MPELYAMSKTHNTFLQGGRKTHIGNDEPLCKQPGNMYTVGLEPIDRDWILSDVQGELCQKCRTAALKLFDAPAQEK